MSYRSDNLASYDHTLLSSVPDPTRAEKQEGYNVDLLEESRDPRAPSPPTNGTASEHNGAVLDYSPGAVSFARKDAPTTNDYEPIEKRVPWYRTRKGIIWIVVVVVLIIIAAAVGGGVGGTRHSSSSSGSSSGVSSNNATNGLGQASPSNGTQQEPNASTSSAPPLSSSGVQQGPRRLAAGRRSLPGNHGARGVA